MEICLYNPLQFCKCVHVHLLLAMLAEHAVLLETLGIEFLSSIIYHVSLA